ncbi:unnamed protein product [Malus baccata var. baccata]
MQVGIQVLEAIAVLEGCMLAKRQGINDVVIECDSKETIFYLQSSIENGSWEALPTLRKIMNSVEFFNLHSWFYGS